MDEADRQECERLSQGNDQRSVTEARIFFRFSVEVSSSQDFAIVSAAALTYLFTFEGASRLTSSTTSSMSSLSAAVAAAAATHKNICASVIRVRAGVSAARVSFK